MQLHEFIDQVGASKLAEILGVSESNVHSWRRYGSSPRPSTAFELITISYNVLSWESIYQPYIDKNYKKRKLKIKRPLTKLELEL